MAGPIVDPSQVPDDGTITSPGQSPQDQPSFIDTILAAQGTPDQQAPATPEDPIASLLAQDPLTNPVGEPQNRPAGFLNEFVNAPPGETSPGTPGPLHPTAVKQGGSGAVSVSHSGVAGGPKTVDATFDAARTRADQRAAEIKAETDQEEATQRGFYDAWDQHQQTINAATEQYRRDVAWVHDNRIEALGKYQDAMKHIEAKAQQVGAEAEKDVRTQLAGLRALAAQDPNPLRHLDASGKASLGLAVAAQGFLKAMYGINTGATDSIDRWVERSMQEHQQQVSEARANMNDRINLWNIARQNSHDEMEAQQRFKAYALELGQAQIESYTAKFQSDIATAEGKQKSIDLASKKEAAISVIRDRRTQRINDVYKAAADEAFKIGELKRQQDAQRLEWAKYGEQVRHNKAEEGAKKAEKAVPIFNVVDPTQRDPKTGGARIIAKFTKDTPEAVQKEVIKNGQSYRTVVAGVSKLKELAGRLQTAYGPDWLRRMTSEERRMFEQEQSLVADTYNHEMTGAASTNPEFERRLKMLNTGEWMSWTPAEVTRNLDMFREYARQKYESSLDAPGIVRAPKDSAEYEDGEKAPIDPAHRATAEIATAPKAPPKVTFGEVAQQNANPIPAPAKMSAQERINLEYRAKTGDEEAQRKLESFERGQSLARGSLTEDEAKMKVPASPAYRALGGGDAKWMPRGFEAVDLLAEALVNPGKIQERAKKQDWPSHFHNRNELSANGVVNDPELLREEAVSQLRRLKQNNAPGVTPSGSPVGAYAARILDLYESDPAALTKMFE